MRPRICPSRRGVGFRPWQRSQTSYGKIASARGFTVGQVAWRIGVKPQEYRALEAGERSPDFDTWDRICKLNGWPQTFVGSEHR